MLTTKFLLIGITLINKLNNAAIQGRSDLPENDHLKHYQLLSEEDLQKLPADELSNLQISETCFEETKFGCFKDLVLFNESREIVLVPPQSPQQINVTFLVVRENGLTPFSFPYDITPGALSELPLSAEKKTIVLIHGWLNNFENSKFWWQPAVENVFKYQKDEFQIIFADWSRGSSSAYYAPAVSNARVAAKAISLLISELITVRKFDPMKIRLIGFSLGAQVAGFVGKQLRGEQKLAWITGLEPANALFQLSSNQGHIYRSDAHYVDIVHTMSGSVFQGFSPMESLGCTDFYPNGALQQVSCVAFFRV